MVIDFENPEVAVVQAKDAAKLAKEIPPEERATIPGPRVSTPDMVKVQDRVAALVAQNLPAMRALAKQIQDKPITGKDYATDVTNLVGQASNMLKELEKWRKWAIGPEDTYVRNINAEVRKAATLAKKIKDLGKQKVADWKSIAELERRKEIKRQEEERKRVQAAIKKEAEEAGVEAPELPAAPAVVKEAEIKVTTETGAGVHTRKDWVWNLVEIKDVPLEYMMLDEKKLNSAVRAGVRNIPGIHIYQKETPIFTGGRRK